MSTSANGTCIEFKICTHVFENPHLGASFVPFMNSTTLFDAMNASIEDLSSGPSSARTALAHRTAPRRVLAVRTDAPRTDARLDSDGVIAKD
jgi:hypothetical protein